LALPDPHPGLVISYAYLWADENARGLEEAAKDRPCAIVVARRLTKGIGGSMKSVVTVVPVTHTEPRDPAKAIEMPAPLKKYLGLEARRSWIVVDETNEFLWPGPALRPVARTRRDTFSYGTLPPKFFGKLRQRLLDIARSNRLRRVVRTD
jgi:hypothetical protein